MSYGGSCPKCRVTLKNGVCPECFVDYNEKEVQPEKVVKTRTIHLKNGTTIKVGPRPAVDYHY